MQDISLTQIFVWQMKKQNHKLIDQMLHVKAEEEYYTNAIDGKT